MLFYVAHYVTLSLKSLKTGNSLMKNYHSGKFPGKRENVSKI